MESSKKQWVTPVVEWCFVSDLEGGITTIGPETLMRIS